MSPISSNQPGEALLPAVARGDRAAVRACIDRYGALVWSLARRHCLDSADAEDAVQEIFVDLWKSAGRFDPSSGAEATFVATIARRRLIDRYRRRARRPEEASGPEPSVGADADAQLDGQRAVRALFSLPPEQREVVRLSTFEGMSHAEIAASTQLPLGTVKSHARRGLLRLRAALHGPAAGAGETEEGGTP